MTVMTGAFAGGRYFGRRIQSRPAIGISEMGPLAVEQHLDLSLLANFAGGALAAMVF